MRVSWGFSVSESIKEESKSLEQTGYVRLAKEHAVALIDAAPIGPDYIPGHAHADTLSFELSIRGRRILVNGGTSTYQNNLQRHKERSTQSHNTVEVNGRNSSEVWGAFRVARRAKPFSRSCELEETLLPFPVRTMVTRECERGSFIIGIGSCRRESFASSIAWKDEMQWVSLAFIFIRTFN